MTPPPEWPETQLSCSWEKMSSMDTEAPPWGPGPLHSPMQVPNSVLIIPLTLLFSQPDSVLTQTKEESGRTPSTRRAPSPCSWGGRTEAESSSSQGRLCSGALQAGPLPGRPPDTSCLSIPHA